MPEAAITSSSERGGERLVELRPFAAPEHPHKLQPAFRGVCKAPPGACTKGDRCQWSHCAERVFADPTVKRFQKH